MPSRRLDERMAHAPWQQPDQQTGLRSRLRNLRPLALPLAAVILLALIWLTPPLRGLAQAIINGLFFQAAPSSSITFTVPATIQPTPIAAAQVWHPESIEAAQAKAGFRVKRPAQLPPGYQFVGADYGANYQMVSQSYALGSGDTVGRNLVIHQYSARLVTPTTIGANANIEIMRIGALTGEYIKGWWDVPKPQATSESPNQVMESTWNPNLEMHFLRWQDGDMAYEILFQATMIPHPAFDKGGAPDLLGYLTRAELIALAASLR
jgi:hypothetical protein